MASNRSTLVPSQNTTSLLMSLPEGWQTGFVSSVHGGALRWGLWTPRGGTYSRVLVFLNGRVEFIEKYSYLPKDLALDLGQDTAFVTLDHRGQGLSGGLRSHIDHYDHFVDDVKGVLDLLVGTRPYTLMAHSMGGLISLYGLKKGAFNPEQLILSAPFLGFPHRPIPRGMAKALAYGLSLVGGQHMRIAAKHDGEVFERNPLTSDAQRYARLQSSPFFDPGVSVGWVRASIEAIQEVQQAATMEWIATPVRILGAPQDQVIDYGGIKDFVSKAPKALVELVEFSEARHELLSESASIYGRVIAQVKGWLGSVAH